MPPQTVKKNSYSCIGLQCKSVEMSEAENVKFLLSIYFTFAGMNSFFFLRFIRDFLFVFVSVCLSLYTCVYFQCPFELSARTHTQTHSHTSKQVRTYTFTLVYIVHSIRTTLWIGKWLRWLYWLSVYVLVFFPPLIVFNKIIFFRLYVNACWWPRQKKNKIICNYFSFLFVRSFVRSFRFTLSLSNIVEKFRFEIGFSFVRKWIVHWQR